MGLKRFSWVRRYQGQCGALRPLGHQGYRLCNYKKDPPLCSSYRGCPAVWSIPHHKTCCSRLSTVRPRSSLWFELRGHSAWQETPSWTVYRLACHRLLPWLHVTFAMVPDAA